LILQDCWGFCAGLTTLHCKISLVKKAHGTACQTTLKRHRNWKSINEIKLFSWNVLSLFRPGSLRILTDVLSDYRADITPIQELRWVGSGVTQKHDCDLYYNCHDSKHILFGTGFIVNKRISHMVIGFESLVMRMCYLHLKSRFFIIDIINVHVPTEDKEEEEKEAFYEKLERAYDKLPANDIRIIVGDMNAKISKQNILRYHAGMYSLHENTSENGSRLVNFAVSKSMFI
jgi:exonuclease III